MSASNGHGGPHHARCGRATLRCQPSGRDGRAVFVDALAAACTFDICSVRPALSTNATPPVARIRRGDDDGHRHERSADRREDAGRGRRDGAREGAGRDGGPRGGAAGPRDRERSRSPHSRPSPRARDDRGSERDRNVRSRPDSPRRDRGRGGSPARRDARGRVDEDRGDRRGGGWRGDGRPDERVRNGKAADRNDRSGGPGFAAGEGRRWEGDRGGGRGDGERGRDTMGAECRRGGRQRRAATRPLKVSQPSVKISVVLFGAALGSERASERASIRAI